MKAEQIAQTVGGSKPTVQFLRFGFTTPPLVNIFIVTRESFDRMFARRTVTSGDNK